MGSVDPAKGGWLMYCPNRELSFCVLMTLFRFGPNPTRATGAESAKMTRRRTLRYALAGVAIANLIRQTHDAML